MTEPSSISFDGWTLHRDSGELERAGTRARLQDLPFQILDELPSRPGELVTRERNNHARAYLNPACSPLACGA